MKPIVGDGNVAEWDEVELRRRLLRELGGLAPREYAELDDDDRRLVEDAAYAAFFDYGPEVSDGALERAMEQFDRRRRTRPRPVTAGGITTLASCAALLPRSWWPDGDPYGPDVLGLDAVPCVVFSVSATAIDVAALIAAWIREEAARQLEEIDAKGART